MSQFLRSIPVLYTLDIDRSVDFYCNRLHFEPILVNDLFAILVRDQLTVHLRLCDDADLPRNTRTYVEVKGIDHLYKEMKMAGVIKPEETLEDKDWDVREFGIEDLDGNTIRFGESLPITPRA